MADRKKELKKTVNSGVTVIRSTTFEFEQRVVTTNQDNLETLIATLLPDLYIVWQSLKLFKVNAEVLPSVIKSIGDISYSTKLGEVIIEIRPDPTTGRAVVKRVRSIDTRHLDLQALTE